MKNEKNIYTFKSPKSTHEEVHFLLTKGRISLKAFLIRFVFSFFICSFIYFIYKQSALLGIEQSNAIDSVDIRRYAVFVLLENFVLFLMPAMFIFFIGIQAVKRLHDTNNSGWLLFVPIYNIYLLLSKGSIGSNDYGLDPSRNPRVEYFDQLPANEISTNKTKGGLRSNKMNVRSRSKNIGKNYTGSLKGLKSLMISLFCVSLILFALLYFSNKSGAQIKPVQQELTDMQTPYIDLAGEYFCYDCEDLECRSLSIKIYELSFSPDSSKLDFRWSLNSRGDAYRHQLGYRRNQTHLDLPSYDNFTISQVGNNTFLTSNTNDKCIFEKSQ